MENDYEECGDGCVVTSEDREKFFSVTNHLFEVMAPAIGPDAFMVYCALRKRAKASKCFPSRQTIADDCGIARNTVIKAIDRLEELHLVHTQIRLRHGRQKPGAEEKRGKYTSCIYTLLDTEKAIATFCMKHPNGYAKPTRKKTETTDSIAHAVNIDCARDEQSIAHGVNNDCARDAHKLNELNVDESELDESKVPNTTYSGKVTTAPSRGASSEKRSPRKPEQVVVYLDNDRLPGMETAAPKDAVQAHQFYSQTLGLPPLARASITRLNKHSKEVGAETFRLAVIGFKHDEYAKDAGYPLNLFFSQDANMLASKGRKHGDKPVESHLYSSSGDLYRSNLFTLAEMSRYAVGLAELGNRPSTIAAIQAAYDRKMGNIAAPNTRAEDIIDVECSSDAPSADTNSLFATAPREQRRATVAAF